MLQCKQSGVKLISYLELTRIINIRRMIQCEVLIQCEILHGSERKQKCRLYISKKHKVITQTILNMHMIIVRSGFTDRRQQYGCLDKQDTRMSAHMLLITYFTIHNILRLENDLSWGTYVVGNWG